MTSPRVARFERPHLANTSTTVLLLIFPPLKPLHKIPLLLQRLCNMWTETISLFFYENNREKRSFSKTTIITNVGGYLFVCFALYVVSAMRDSLRAPPNPLLSSYKLRAVADWWRRWVPIPLPLAVSRKLSHSCHFSIYIHTLKLYLILL